MRTIYLDCFAGAAGDMIIGALLNLVPSPDILRDGLKKLTALSPDEYELVIEESTKNGIAGINFDVILPGHEHEHEHDHHGHEHAQEHAHDHDEHHAHDHDEHHAHDHAHDHDEHEHDHHHVHRGLPDIEEMIASSGLSNPVKREALRAFSLLAEAEAHVHGTTPDKIHFHEVGAVDSIIDIVGTFILMEALAWPRVLSSPINTGSGTVTCAHGVLPVPAPATAHLLQGLPVFSSGSPMERTTPTGALLLRMLVNGFGPIPPGRIVASGFGLGNRTSPDMPNVLRALLLEGGSEDEDGLVHERLILLECNIDDMNPQDFEPVCEKLFHDGALDVWTEPIYMKKGRPAVRFCCLVEPEQARELTMTMLRETTSQGVRQLDISRARLNWRIDKLSTILGELNVKTALIGETPLRRTPEYEDLKRLSIQHGLPMAEIRRRVAQEL